ncbi:MAG TPA: hypothetical protein VGB84_08805, partial [Arachidicoccus sp.]
MIKKTMFVVVLCAALFSCSKNDSDVQQPSNGSPTTSQNDSDGQQSSHDRPATAQSSPYPDTLLAYMPAPGQFVNTSTANNAAAESITGGTSGIVSLGAFGGYIVLGFDHTVLNGTGSDMKIIGNASAQDAEPGVAWVMHDDNGNGKADDKWYELKGSELGKTGYIRNYSVTYNKPLHDSDDVKWADNQGNTGVIKHNIYH